MPSITRDESIAERFFKFMRSTAKGDNFEISFFVMEYRRASKEAFMISFWAGVIAERTVQSGLTEGKEQSTEEKHNHD